MHEFVVYPREALLIGMCVGESECTQHKYFRSTIAERIEAFFGRSDTEESTLLDTLDSICDNLDEVQLKSRLEQLCGTQRALFLLGLDFGRLLYDVSEFMSNDQFDAVAGISQVEQLVSRLLVNPLVSANHFASQALQSLPKVLREQFERIMNGEYCLPPDLFLVVDPPLMRYWIAVGELMGVLRDVDAEFDVCNSEAVSPRKFPAHTIESLDSIVQNLKSLDWELANRPDEILPENIIRQTAAYIEVLVKRIWASEVRFSGNSIAKVLGDKLNGNQISASERRFASIARTLHLSYRNPAYHESMEFNCSLREAKFFLTGLHALTDLLSKIEPVPPSSAEE